MHDLDRLPVRFTICDYALSRRASQGLHGWASIQRPGKRGGEQGLQTGEPPRLPQGMSGCSCLKGNVKGREVMSTLGFFQDYPSPGFPPYALRSRACVVAPGLPWDEVV
jgi:hypothetical protein